jgi:hypothetical protein
MGSERGGSARSALRAGLKALVGRVVPRLPGQGRLGLGERVIFRHEFAARCWVFVGRRSFDTIEVFGLHGWGSQGARVIKRPAVL